MNNACPVILGAMLATSLLAQSETNPARPPVQEAKIPTPPPSPLSNETRVRIDKMTSLFYGRTLDGWVCFTNNAWAVRDGAMTSLGAGRGVIYTKNEYGNYRLIFNMRPVSGPRDHQACFLVFCTTPPEGGKGLDALGGIQFQPPNGGSWDYRPRHNNSGKGLFDEYKDVRIEVDPKEDDLVTVR